MYSVGINANTVDERIYFVYYVYIKDKLKENAWFFFQRKKDNKVLLDGKSNHIFDAIYFYPDYNQIRLIDQNIYYL